MGAINNALGKILNSVSMYEDDTPHFQRTQIVSIVFSANVTNGQHKVTLNGNGKSWFGEGTDYESALACAQEAFKTDVNKQIERLSSDSKNRIDRLKKIR